MSGRAQLALLFLARGMKGPPNTFTLAITQEEATQIISQDPFVLAGEVKPEVHPWQAQKGVLRK